MKRIRLDIGALTASPKEGGKFLFFLYKENMDRCLPISYIRTAVWKKVLLKKTSMAIWKGKTGYITSN